MDQVLTRCQYFCIGFVIALAVGAWFPCTEAQEFTNTNSVKTECGTVVTMDDGTPGHVVAIGELNAADHEIDSGWWHIGEGHFNFQVNPASMAQSFFLLNRAKEIQVVIRPFKRLQPKREVPR